MVRVNPRPRRRVPGPVLALLKPLFRYDYLRDAYVLRAIGNRVGPVLQPARRPDQAGAPSPIAPDQGGARSPITPDEGGARSASAAEQGGALSTGTAEQGGALSPGTAEQGGALSPNTVTGGGLEPPPAPAPQPRRARPRGRWRARARPAGPARAVASATPRAPPLIDVNSAAGAVAVAAVFATGAASGPASAGSGAASVIVGHSVRGRPIQARVVGDSALARRRVMVVGCVHGDERAGEAITRSLRRTTAPPGTALWLVDSFNPDGSAARTRQNAHGVDLNRNQPWRWRRLDRPGGTYYSGPRPLSEPGSP